MSTEYEEISAASRTKSNRRYWRRTDNPKRWWPWGFLPAAGLVMLFLFGAFFTAPRIEAEVRNEVASRFDAVGLTATDVASNGQAVAVRTEGSSQDTVYLQALAKTTQCETWAGSLTCAVSANVVVDRVEAAPAVVTLRPHPFTVVRNANGVQLSGEVPNLAERDRILVVAGQHFDIIDDELIVSNEIAAANDARAANISLAVVSKMESGQANWSGSALTVKGIANADAIAATREQFRAFGSSDLLGEFDVVPVPDAQNCNDGFSRILSEASVRFQTNSATIDAGNEILLGQLAELAQNCPGSLIIEGHTDSRGDADMNKALSLARAMAVRDALAGLGVDAARLSATGLGEAQPIADNSSAQGRAQNRRIAILIRQTD
jgi:outer membrane protein OmpA-like peptidoglycan-associated protein